MWLIYVHIFFLLFENGACSDWGIVYKPEGRGLKSQWDHWIFTIYLSFQPHYGPGADSASNRNEYQKMFLESRVWLAHKSDTLSTIFEPIA
jgi:hypothetical protein